MELNLTIASTSGTPVRKHGGPACPHRARLVDVQEQERSQPANHPVPHCRQSGMDSKCPVPKPGGSMKKEEFVTWKTEEARGAEDCRGDRETETMRTRELDRRDLEAWMGACNAHTYSAYELYAKSFPTGKYRDIALQRYRLLKPFWRKNSFR
jgi:hypothetical protein